MKTISISLFTTILMLISVHLQAQALDAVYFSEKDSTQYELKMLSEYLVLSVYQKSPAKFIKTWGGFFTLENDTLKVRLEFNSNYEKDSLTVVQIPIKIEKNQIQFQSSKLDFKRSVSQKQTLDNLWLFGTRGPDTGQARRGDTKTRKTLKFLIDGRFQWIAYDTDGMQFKGSGGGAYTAIDGKYTERIEYFSRDNSRVGAALVFDYETKGSDWHHTGNNSKGKPMYEIWQQRPTQKK